MPSGQPMDGAGTPWRAASVSLAGGQGRSNEDAHAVEPHPLDAGVWLAVLADGQGGQRGGGAAARLACAATLAELVRTPAKALARPTFWCELLQRTDRAVAADADAGFTTLVAFALVGEYLIGASSGDSAVAVVPATGRLVELTANQRKNPPIGSGGAVVVPFGARLVLGDVLLAMSDGVWKYAGWDAIESVVRTQPVAEVLGELERRVRPRAEGALPDDFTAILLAQAGGEATPVDRLTGEADVGI